MPERVDDAELGNDETLLRRILDRPNDWFTQNDDGTIRPSSAAFKDGNNELSVNVASLTTIDAVSAERPDDGIVSLLAGLPRSLGHIIAKTEEPDDPEDPSPRVICAPLDHGKKARMREAKALALAATWVLPPASRR